MLQLSRFGKFPRRFLKLRNDLPPCIPGAFGKSHCKPCQNKTPSTGGTDLLKKLTYSKAGDKVATNQVVSAHPRLVPQEKESPTCARTWDSTVFVDYATDYRKVHLVQYTSGDSTLESKNALREILWS